MGTVEIRNEKGLTVYLDGRLLVQIQSGEVTACQAHDLAQTKMIKDIIRKEGLGEYSVVKGFLIKYMEGIPNVRKINHK